MSKSNKSLLLGFVGAVAFLPLSSMAQSALTCSGAPPNMAALEATIRHEEGVRKGAEVINKVIHALNAQILTVPNSEQFNTLLDFVLSLQANPAQPTFYIESPTVVDSREGFVKVGERNIANFKYRNRDITNWIVQSYQDVNCLRTITLNGLGHTYGVLKGEPTGRRTSKNFVDLDRIKVVIVETAPGVFRSKEVYQFTEASFPYAYDPLKEAQYGLTNPASSPLNADWPAYLPFNSSSQ